MVLRSQRGRVAVPPQEYNEERFEELVLYIAWETREDPDFGRTKLAKVLFYSDFTAYLDEGKAFTGARYEAWPNGPFPPVLYDVEKALAAEGRAKVERLDVGPDRGRVRAVQDPSEPTAGHDALRVVGATGRRPVDPPGRKRDGYENQRPLARAPGMATSARRR